MKFRTNIKYVLIWATVTAFLGVSVFGIFGMMEMDHNEAGNASTCPFMAGETVLCVMNAFDHIASWQAMTASLPLGLFTIISLLIALALPKTWLRYLFGPPDTLEQQSLFSYSRETHPLPFALLLLESTVSPRAP
ncbi:MAG: hypothetical protein A2481_02560 [Candidatus Yonathbacteria bacterium RIFOXYC2_FULL_47_9]|nr:MAG: hypothetical protein A2481_02560 [Candidatus Yonathbacteria bacterium RIFOXYC2_FULL_47_9]HAT68581.1 hypothetical protein [Candidatus Yonathbacteria bacterium]